MQRKKELKDNTFLKSLVPIIFDPDYKVNGIQLLNKKLSAMETDLLAEDLRDLMTHPKYEVIGKLIVYAGIVQTGLYPSYISFLDKLPSDVYGDLTKQIIEDFDGNPETLSTFVDQFFKNNWKDNTIVPYAPRKAKVHGQILKAESPYQYLKQGDNLYKKTSEGTYTLTGKLGDPKLFKEYYPVLKDSMIISNNIQEAVEQEKQMVEEKFKSKVLGTIQTKIIEDWVQSGQATTTVRNSKYHKDFYKGNGIYQTTASNLVNIIYKGVIKLQGDKVIGKDIEYTKDEFSKAEGFGNWKGFQKGAEYAGITLMEGGEVHLYNITPFDKKTQLELGLDEDLTTNDFKC